MKRIAALFLLVAISCAAETPTCNHSKIKILADPPLYENTVACVNGAGLWMWALGIYGSHHDWEKNPQLADVYMGDHEAYKRIPVKSHSVYTRCTPFGECLRVTFYKTGYDKKAHQEYAWIRLYGYEE